MMTNPIVGPKFVSDAGPRPSSPTEEGGLKLATEEVSNKEALEHIHKEINELFHSKADFFNPLLESADINFNYEGFTPLHYCIYMLNYISRPLPASVAYLYLSPPDPIQQGNRCLNLIEYLLENGANIDCCDEYGRTPIYFASTLHDPGLNRRFFDICLSKAMLKTDSSNPIVSPLHVVAQLSGKYVVDLIKTLGADIQSIDRFGRVPLHCAAMSSTIDPRPENINCLIYYGPEGAEKYDNFGYSPLDYALIFSDSSIIETLIACSSPAIIAQALEKVEKDTFPDSEDKLRKFIEEFHIYDPIYNIPRALKEYIGAGKEKRTTKQAKTKKLEETQKTKTKSIIRGDQTYYIHHDGHGWKHVVGDPTSKQKYESNKRQFIIDTGKKGNAAKFYPDIVHSGNYEEWVEDCATNWVNSGADSSNMYVTHQNPVGADNGKETKTIEIYMTDVGAHIRPKYIE